MNNADKPAYPDPMRGGEQSIINQSPHCLNEGMTKREIFAKAAMQGILAKEAWSARILQEGGDDTMAKQMADASVKMADLLLKQLEL